MTLFGFSNTGNTGRIFLFFFAFELTNRQTCCQRVTIPLGDPWVIQLTSTPCTCSISKWAKCSGRVEGRMQTTVAGGLACFWAGLSSETWNTLGRVEEICSRAHRQEHHERKLQFRSQDELTSRRRKKSKKNGRACYRWGSVVDPRHITTMR